MKQVAAIQLGLKGRINKICVIERGHVVREYPGASNLILNQGLDQIASHVIADCTLYATAGTGATPTEIASGSDTAALIAGSVTLSSTGYLAGNSSDVGRTFKLDANGLLYTVTAFGDTTHCSVTPPDSVSANTFTIYNTEQTGLIAETSGQRSNTYLSGSPNCQTSTIGAVTTLTRTYDLPAVAGPVTFNEVGFSNSATAGNNLFSRVKLPSGVPLLTGQQLRVQYSVAVTISPITPLTFAVSPIVGWTGATGTLQAYTVPLAWIQTSGLTAPSGVNSVDGAIYLSSGEPSVNSPNGSGNIIVLDTYAGAHSTYGTNPSINTGNAYSDRWVQSVYTSGVYTRDKFITIPVSLGNRVDWRSFYLGFSGSPSFWAYRYLFDSSQTKLSTFTLTLGFRQTWGRIL